MGRSRREHVNGASRRAPQSRARAARVHDRPRSVPWRYPPRRPSSSTDREVPMIAAFRPRGSAVATAIVSIVLVCLPNPSRAAAPAQVDDALAKAKTWVYAKQASGTWEAAAGFGDTHGDQSGGLTALAVYALLAAG